MKAYITSFEFKFTSGFLFFIPGKVETDGFRLDVFEKEGKFTGDAYYRKNFLIEPLNKDYRVFYSDEVILCFWGEISSDSIENLKNQFLEFLKQNCKELD